MRVFWVIFPRVVFWWICGLSRRSKAMLSTFLVDLSQCWTQSDPFGTSNIKWDYCVACTEYVFFFRQNITWWLNDKNNKRSLVALLGLRSYLRTLENDRQDKRNLTQFYDLFSCSICNFFSNETGSVFFAHSGCFIRECICSKYKRQVTMILFLLYAFVVAM